MHGFRSFALLQQQKRTKFSLAGDTEFEACSQMLKTLRQGEASGNSSRSTWGYFREQHEPDIYVCVCVTQQAGLSGTVLRNCFDDLLRRCDRHPAISRLVSMAYERRDCAAATAADDMELPPSTHAVAVDSSLYRYAYRFETRGSKPA